MAKKNKSGEKDSGENKYLKRAAREALIEFLGYEESKAYYLMLTNQQKEIEKRFSHSKKYRLLKRLFQKGAMGKVKGEKRDSYNYILLPPSFLELENTEKEIIKYLEKLYHKNHSKQLIKKFSKLILKDSKGLLLYLLKRHMKHKARLLLDGSKIEDLIDNRKINIIENDEKIEKNLGVIDDQIAFEFSNIGDKKSEEYIGYLTNQQSERVDRVREKIENTKKLLDSSV